MKSEEGSGRTTVITKSEEGSGRTTVITKSEGGKGKNHNETKYSDPSQGAGRPWERSLGI